MDAGHKETDEILERLEKRVHDVYSKAVKDMKAKQRKAMKEYDEELKANKERLRKGEISQKEFDGWIKDQATGAAWRKSMVEALTRDLVNADKLAAAIVSETMSEVYAVNFNFGTYQAEQAAGVSTAFTLYSADTVNELVKENPDLLPESSVDVKKDERWNRQKLTSAITQSILQGEGIQGAAERLQTVAKMDDGAAIRNARTMLTAAQNLGRQKSYERAREKGIELEKEWVATLDKRTRRRHRQLDGERVPIDEEFSNGCRFPGDPSGPKGEVYNCRCTMVTHFVGDKYEVEERFSRLGKLSYAKWKEGANG